MCIKVVVILDSKFMVKGVFLDSGQQQEIHGKKRYILLDLETRMHGCTLSYRVSQFFYVMSDDYLLHHHVEVDTS